MKKSQITLFMLFGLLILFIIGFFLVTVTWKSTTTETTAPLQSYVEQCIADVGATALTYTGLQGGYYQAPDTSYIFGQFTIPYFMNENAPLLPSEEEMENQLALFMNERLERCIGNFSSFKEQGYEISTLPASTTVSIEENTVTFSVQYPITAVKNTNTATYSAFTVSIPSSLFLARSVTQEVLDAHESDAKLPMSKITKISDTYAVPIDLGNFNATVIYALNLPDSPRVFRFAMHYSWGEQSE